MFKCYFILDLIGGKYQYYILLIGLLMFVVGSQNVSAQQQIALDAHAILEQSCFVCHGPTGSFRDALLIERNALIENGTVVPGNPHTSELYNRLITTDLVKRMPLNQPPLSAQAINTIRNWILAGAPDWTATTTPSGNFISHGEILSTIETHLMSLESFDRAFARYFTMTHLYNAGESVGILQEYRKALFKLVNSLSWGVEVINPEPIDSQGTIFYIDLRHYEWDVNDGWGQIETAYPYHISFDAPAQTALKQQLGRLQTEMNSNIPSVHVDWFVATASLPPLYHDLLSLPLTDRELETRLEVDVLRNINNAPGVRVWRAGTNDSGVSANNRVLERHTSRYGAYWKSYDFAGSAGTQNIFTHPLNFTYDGGEVIFNLPNGLQGYLIVNASGFRLDAAPIDIVSNPAASDPTVRTGLSCFGCHIEGMNTFEDQVRSVIESSATPDATALRLYVEKSEMDARVQEDIDTYREALEETGGAFSDIEPISRFHEAFQGTVDAAYAAAVVGLETETFLQKIHENVGLQNAGLLVLDSQNGSVKRDVWTSSFSDILFALDFPTLVDKTPVVPDPDRPPGSLVHIPDTNLRAAIAEVLGKSPNAPITVEEMERLVRLNVANRDVRNLTGLQFATNLIDLNLNNNRISDLSSLANLINLRELRINQSLVSDISPLRGLTNLTELWIRRSEVSDLSPIAGLINLTRVSVRSNPITDISPLRGLINLTELWIGYDTPVSDLSPIAGLVNLKGLDVDRTNVSDLSPVAGLINLEWISFSHEDLSDLSPLAGLSNLKKITSWRNSISDLSPLAGLAKLEKIDFARGNISDLTPLAGLTGLKELRLAAEEISDISPIANLTGLTHLGLENNNISDISPIANLTNLTRLAVNSNNISDFSPLDGIRENITLIWYDNPAFPTGGPKIEGPWLWIVLPDRERELETGIDILAEASGGTVTETEIATHGAIEGDPVRDSVWTSHRLPPTGANNITNMLKNVSRDAAIYGSVSLYSPREQETTMYVGSDYELRVWLNGALVYKRLNSQASTDYNDFFPVTLQQGRNVLLIVVAAHANAFIGFQLGTDYTVSTGVGYAISKTPIHLGDTFTLEIRAENVSDLAGWQFDIAFDPAALEAISVTEGNFLKTGSTTFFQSGSIDNVAGNITGLNAARLSTQGVSGAGTLLQVRFKAKSIGETELAMHKFEFGTASGGTIPAGPLEIYITVKERLATGDVNRDGRVSILDLILVAQQLGSRVSAGSAVDVNGDGVVSILDLIRVAQGIAGSTAAPRGGTERVDAATIGGWIAQARLEDDGSLAFRQGIENLQALLASLRPEKTALLRNYPNPFNPETWIPYQLAHAVDVALAIYDTNGVLVRQLDLGYQQAGYYTDRTRAAYWDGRNHLGEAVGSGIYFYQLRAGDYSTIRKMVILK